MTKEVFLNVDWWDNTYFCNQVEGEPYDADRVRKDIESYARAGVTSLLWRVTGLGRVAHHSKVELMPSKHELSILPPALKPAVELLKSYDPFETAIEACRENNIKIYAWVDMYDEYNPGCTGRFTTENPQCQFVDRSGNFYFKGVPSYAYEETRRFKLRYIKELSAYEADGIFLSNRSHANHWNQYHQVGVFGYNKPVVDEYKRRSGVDLCDLEKWDATGWPKSKMVYDGPVEDKQLLYTIQGEFHTKYLSEVKEILSPKSQRLIVDVGMGEFDGVPPGFAAFRYEHEKWFEQSIVDQIVLLLYPTGGWASEEYYNINDYLSMAWKYRVHPKSSVIAWINVNVNKYTGLDSIAKLSKDLCHCHGASLIEGFAFHEAAAFLWAKR